MNSGFQRSIVIFCTLMFLTSFSGCSGSGSATKPTTDKIVTECANRVRQFIEQAEKTKDAEKVKADLDLMMESLEAEASEFGGSSDDILKAAKELQSLLGSGASKDKLTAGLKEFKSQIDGISPAE